MVASVFFVNFLFSTVEMNLVDDQKVEYSKCSPRVRFDFECAICAVNADVLMRF